MNAQGDLSRNGRLLVCVAALLAICLPPALAATSPAADELIFTVPIPEPRLLPVELYGRPFTRPVLPGCFPAGERVGAPEVLALPLRLLLPAGCEAAEVEVDLPRTLAIDPEARGLESFARRPVVPYQPPVPIGQAPPARLACDEAAYRSPASLPAVSFRSLGTGYSHGYAILTLNLFPTRYVAAEGRLFYHPEMTVRVRLRETGERARFFRPEGVEDRRWVERIVANPELLASYDRMSGQGREYTGGLCDPGDNDGLGYDYVIILRQGLYTYTATHTWEEFIARKEAQGLETTRVTVEEILACADYENADAMFNDTPARIREFCRDAYEDWGIQYVLVAGDQDGSSAVTRREMDYESEYDQETDIYWSNLDNTFNADHDSYWGERGDSGFDLYGELFIGSVPCDTGQDLSNWMNKAFYYADSSDQDYLENAGFYGGDTGWDVQGDDFVDYSAIMGLDDFLGPDPHYDWPYPEWLGFQYGFETWNEENAGSGYDLTEKWTAEPPNPGGWQGGDWDVAITGLRNAINGDRCTLISAIAHADPYMSMDVDSGSWEASYHNTRPFFLHDYGCHCGDMNGADDGVLHSMLFHSDTELAFACVYNTGYGWGSFGSTGSSSAIQQKSFWDYLFDVTNISGSTAEWQMGKAMAFSRDMLAPGIDWDEYYGTWRGIYQCCLLFGDPAQRLKPPAAVEPLIATGPGPGPDNPAEVRLFSPLDLAAPLHTFTAYGVDRYGVNVVLGDFDGDAVPEVVTGPGPGAVFGPHVRGWELEGTAVPGASFLAYGTQKYGANVACGDLDGDGLAEIVTGAGPGAVFGPHVRAFRYAGEAVTPMPGVSFFAYGTHKWGVNVACGDLDGDGMDEVVTGAGPGAVFGPHVRAFDCDGSSATPVPGVSFFAYGTHKFGVNVACGDLDGDGRDEIVTGPGPSSAFPPHVRGWDYSAGAIQAMPGVSFLAGSGSSWGARVGAGALDLDPLDEILTAPGPGSGLACRVRGWNVDGGTAAAMPDVDFVAYDVAVTYGGKVAGARVP